jgi:uncharacterized protein (DUF1778 family)
MARKQAKAQREKTRSDELGCAQRLTRSERDRRAFFAALINPPKPSGRLDRALAEHKRRIAR